jgi:hypothetical protein
MRNLKEGTETTPTVMDGEGNVETIPEDLHGHETADPRNKDRRQGAGGRDGNRSRWWRSPTKKRWRSRAFW